MEPLDDLSRIALRMKEAVIPLLGSGKGLAGVASQGDTTFELDVVAEEALVQGMADVGFAGLCYSEDKGLREVSGGGRRFLVVDPVDGTRPAVSGLESCCISLALAEGGAESRLSDVRWAWVEELRSETAFVAEAGKGAWIWNRETGQSTPPKVSSRTGLDQLFYTFELVGRPVALITGALGSLINDTTLDGGCFLLNSSCFSLTRLLTGQFDAHIDLAGRILEEVPGAREEFMRVGKGRTITVFPYDVAGVYLIAREAGCTVTDACGRSLDEFPLMGTPRGRELSLLAACTAKLHREVLERIHQGISSLKESPWQKQASCL